MTRPASPTPDHQSSAAADDELLRQLFLNADSGGPDASDGAFVSSIMETIDLEERQRATRRRTAVEWTAAGAGILAAALLPQAVGPLQAAFEGVAATSVPLEPETLGSSSSLMLMLGLAALATLGLLTRRA